MFLGPGRFGDFIAEKSAYEALRRNQRTGGAEYEAIAGLVNRASPGDLVLAREGKKVVALGVIPPAGHYLWNKNLDDVHGWDLQHSRRVNWCAEVTDDLREIQESSGQLFGSRKQIPKFTAVEDESVLGPIRHLFERIGIRELKDAPPDIGRPLEDAEFKHALFLKGMSYDVANHVVSVIRKQRALLMWYSQKGGDFSRPTEHEVVAHMIVPLLRACGWSEQQLAVEWHNIDLAVCLDLNRGTPECILICEAKGLGAGLDDAYSQAKVYADKRLCSTIMTTDGMRIYIFTKHEGVWSDDPEGYCNLSKIREAHLSPKNTNGVQTLMKLTPALLARS